MAAIAVAVTVGAFFWGPSAILPQGGSDRSTAPSPLVVKAFKVGRGLSEMVASSGSARGFSTRKSQTEAHMIGLGVDPRLLRRMAEDGKLTPEEAALLRERLRAKIRSRHGAEASATFVIGAEIAPATEAFVSYLTHEKYRADLIKKGVSIVDFGVEINANIDEALLPEEIKEKWPSLYGAVIRGLNKHKVIQAIKGFKGEILRYFDRSG